MLWTVVMTMTMVDVLVVPVVMMVKVGVVVQKDTGPSWPTKGCRQVTVQAQRVHLLAGVLLAPMRTRAATLFEVRPGRPVPRQAGAEGVLT